MFISLFINSKEVETEKIKETIILMITLNSNNTIPPFSFQFKNNLLNFTNFSYFDVVTKNMNLIQDSEDNYILSDIKIIFKSGIIVNNFKTSKTHFLIEVDFEKMIFIENDYFINITEVIPSSLYISNNSQLSHLSYFKEFNNLNNMTYIDEYGNKTENSSIISIFLQKSKECILNKLLNIQNSFNLLTNDLDKILNIIMSKSLICPNYMYSLLSIYSLDITKVEIPLNHIYAKIEDGESYLMINKMKFYGNFFYYISMKENKIINFNFFNDESNIGYFDQNQFYLNIKQEKISYDKQTYLNDENIYEILIVCLANSINNEVENYFNN